MKKEILNTLILSLIAGIMISIGCIVFLSCESKYVGALAFSCGLFFICEMKFKLYTGAIGYALENDKKNNILLLFILIGNFLGTLLMVGIVLLTRIYDGISLKAIELVDKKMNDSWYSVLLLAVLCGVMIYIGVDTFKKSSNPFSKVMAIIYCVFVFIISAYEHCIANMFYIMVSNTWSWKAVLYIALMIIGNSLGGLLIPGLIKIANSNKKNEIKE